MNEVIIKNGYTSEDYEKLEYDIWVNGFVGAATIIKDCDGDNTALIVLPLTDEKIRVLLDAWSVEI